MMSILPIGSLVVSDSFEGIGKVISLDIEAGNAKVAFLSHPHTPIHVRLQLALKS